MRQDAANMVRNAANCCTLEHYRFDLNRLADNMDLVRNGKVTLEDFARHYCLIGDHLKPEPLCRICRVKPVDSHGACDPCYTAECEESEAFDEWVSRVSQQPIAEFVGGGP